MMPKGPAANKFPAMQRTGSIPFPVLLTVVMYDRIKYKENMLDGNCMCNQRLFDKGYDAFVCNEYATRTVCCLNFFFLLLLSFHMFAFNTCTVATSTAVTCASFVTARL